jgi:hypothetical protein
VIEPSVRIPWEALVIATPLDRPAASLSRTGAVALLCVVFSACGDSSSMVSCSARLAAEWSASSMSAASR